MKTSGEGLAHIKKWEGLRTKAYQDVAGIWTIGYGHTSTAGGLKVTPGLVISEKQAEEVLRGDLGKFEKRVNDLVKVPLSQNQFDALVSFDFNTGALGKSTLLKKLNKGDYKSIPSELMKWNKATVNGKLVAVKGLTNRRTDEVKLWNANSKPQKIIDEAPKDYVPEVPVTKENFWVRILKLILGVFIK